MDLRIFYLEKEERGPDVEKLFLLFLPGFMPYQTAHRLPSTHRSPQSCSRLFFLQQQATPLNMENNSRASPRLWSGFSKCHKLFLSLSMAPCPNFSLLKYCNFEEYSLCIFFGPRWSNRENHLYYIVPRCS